MEAEVQVALDGMAILIGEITKILGNFNMALFLLGFLVGSALVIAVTNMFRIRKLKDEYNKHMHTTSYGPSGKIDTGGIINEPNRKN